MMKILLAGINAKFIHSCLAVHSLRCYAKEQYHIRAEAVEYTINQRREDILGDLFRRKPDILGFSCYIWNISYIKPLVREIRLVLPEVKILLGGPEVSYGPGEVLAETGADYILTGEGEESFSRLCLALEHGGSLADVPGLTWREGTRLIQNPPPAPLDMARLPFIYEDFSLFADRILYYEAQRGCPFNCQYCLSSVEKGVRFQPLAKVKRELTVFLEKKVRQVKFVDRTFNTNAGFAMEIWRFLHEHDNGVTNFHFELAADLLTEEMLEFLPKVRPGLFQFEIGVQSTNPPTLAAVDRKCGFGEISARVKALQAGKNIHLHLDLIAGLPYEDFIRFGQSFDEVYALSPDQFQLGFLKLLKGSGLRRDRQKYGIVSREETPYEVLFTDALSFSDLLKLKDIEELVDSFYNSCRFRKSLSYLVGLAERPFVFYLGFSAYYREKGLYEKPSSKLGQFEALYDYGSALPGCRPEILSWLMKYDLSAREKPKKLPSWMPGAGNQEGVVRFFSEAENIRRYLPEYAGLEGKLVSKLAHLEFFPFDPRDGAEQETAVLFNYRKTDVLGNAVTVFLSRDIFK